MKRVLVCLLAIIAIFGLTGCKDNKKVKKEEKKGTATVLKNATAKIGEYDITFDKEAGFHEMKYKYPSTATYGNIDAYTIIDQLDGGNLIYRIAMYYFEEMPEYEVMRDTTLTKVGEVDSNEKKENWTIYKGKEDDKDVTTLTNYYNGSTYIITFISDYDINYFMDAFLSTIIF